MHSLWKDFRLCKIHVLSNYIAKMIHLHLDLHASIKFFFFFFLSSYRIVSCILFNVACSSVMSMFNFCSNVQVAWRCPLFHFLRFLQASYHPSRLHARLPILAISWHLGFRGCCGCLRCEFYLAVCCESYSSGSSFPLCISLVYIKLRCNI